MEDLIFDLVYEKVKDLPTKSQTKLLEGVQKDLFSLAPKEQVGKVLDILKNFKNSKNFKLLNRLPKNAQRAPEAI